VHSLQHSFLRISLSAFLVGLILLSLSLSVQAAKGSIGFDTFKLQHLGERVYRVNAQLKYELSDYLYQSLQNGVTLRSETRINLGNERKFWWNGSSHLTTINVSLSYHALSEHYRVVREDTDEHWNFRSLRSALQKLGEIRGYKLPALTENIEDGSYFITVSARITPESISFPMRVQSVFVNKYALKTTGAVWPLP
jgi:hypothetical protein